MPSSTSPPSATASAPAKLVPNSADVFTAIGQFLTRSPELAAKAVSVVDSTGEMMLCITVRQVQLLVKRYGELGAGRVDRSRHRVGLDGGSARTGIVTAAEIQDGRYRLLKAGTPFENPLPSEG